MSHDHSIKQALVYGYKLLQSVDIDSYMLDTRLLLEKATGLSHIDIIIYDDKILTQDQYSGYLQLLERRAKHEPIAYILGFKEFWGLTFEVNRHTLIPRADSETVIHAVIDSIPRDQFINILDIGTGTGCLALSLLHEYKNAQAIAIDISPEAIKVAKNNATKLKLANRSCFLVESWKGKLDNMFDVIVSNPPYISESDIKNLSQDVRLYEPVSALLGGQDGLDCYKEILTIVPNILNKNGIVILECGINQISAVIDIAAQMSLKAAKTFHDLSGIERCVLLKHA